MATGGNRMQWLAVIAAALALAASSCTGSATVTQTGSNADGDTAEPTPVTVDEPTPVAQTEEAATPDAEETPTPAPDRPPAQVLSVEAFRTEAVIGLSNDGAYGYAGTSSPWNDPTSCDSPATESLVVTDIVAGAGGDVTVIAAGLEQVGDVRQVLFGAGNSAAVLSSCVRIWEDPALWLQRVEFAANGSIASRGERIDVGGPNESDPYLLGWTADDILDVRVIIEQDPDDAATWIVERRELSMATGQVVSREQFDFFADDGFSGSATLTTPDGFTYRVIDDPAGGLGCEGFGVARTLELDTGSEQRLALTQPGLVFSNVTDLHMSPAGYIAWTSGCEGFVSAYVGRVLEDGMIADAHLIETFSFLADTYVDFQYYRLTNNGFLNAVGQSFNPDDDDTTVEFLHYDLRSDPHFVNTAEPAPQIDQAALFPAVGDGGTWHVGDTLAADIACGGRTLYGQTAGGFVRAFPAGFEIDAIVDADLGETHRISFPDGDFVNRTVVISTECPGSYEGRRVWFGSENDQIVWGIGLSRADLGEVANVLSVRDVLQEDSQFIDYSLVQVELLDGSVADIELVAIPQSG